MTNIIMLLEISNTWKRAWLQSSSNLTRIEWLDMRAFAGQLLFNTFALCFSLKGNASALIHIKDHHKRLFFNRFHLLECLHYLHASSCETSQMLEQSCCLNSLFISHRVRQYDEIDFTEYSKTMSGEDFNLECLFSDFAVKFFSPDLSLQGSSTSSLSWKFSCKFSLQVLSFMKVYM